MKIQFLYRVKKYGTWNEGEMVVEKNSQLDLTDLVKAHLKEMHPESNRIEVQSIRKR